MQTVTRNDSDHAAGSTSLPSLPDTDALLSELGVLYPVMTFAGAEGDEPPTDAWEAPSGFSTTQGDEERRSEMDARIMAGLASRLAGPQGHTSAAPRPRGGRLGAAAQFGLVARRET